jgi:hypothetical protein
MSSKLRGLLDALDSIGRIGRGGRCQSVVTGRLPAASVPSRALVDRGPRVAAMSSFLGVVAGAR